MYNMDNKAVAFVDANGDLIPKVKLEPWTDLYVTPTRVNEQLLEALELASAYVLDDTTYDKEVKKKVESAIKKALAAEPTPLVRLTEKEVIDAYMLSNLNVPHSARIDDLCSFANVLQDAMIAKNGGKEERYE